MPRPDKLATPRLSGPSACLRRRGGIDAIMSRNLFVPAPVDDGSDVREHRRRSSARGNTDRDLISLSPPTEKYIEGFWAFGRYYSAWQPMKYLFPIDAEELNRLDIFHKFFLVARRKELCCPAINLGRPARIMDLGTGTGIWAINVADASEHVPHIMAVDINRIQPKMIPPGMVTVQFDIESQSWDSLLKDCDIIHIRMLHGSLDKHLWYTTYKKIFDHLTSGTGILEHVEIDWEPRWDEMSDVPEKSAFREWAETFLRALDLCGRGARVSSYLKKEMIEEAGFCDFRERVIRCYVNPWSSDAWEQETARWFNLGLSLGLEAMSLLPMIDKLGMTVAQVNELCRRVKEENTILRYHGYCNLHIWTARKPPSFAIENRSLTRYRNAYNARRHRWIT